MRQFKQRTTPTSKRLCIIRVLFHISFSLLPNSPSKTQRKERVKLLVLMSCRELLKHTHNTDLNKQLQVLRSHMEQPGGSVDPLATHLACSKKIIRSMSSFPCACCCSAAPLMAVAVAPPLTSLVKTEDSWRVDTQLWKKRCIWDS